MSYFCRLLLSYTLLYQIVWLVQMSVYTYKRDILKNVTNKNVRVPYVPLPPKTTEEPRSTPN